MVLYPPPFDSSFNPHSNPQDPNDPYRTQPQPNTPNPPNPPQPPPNGNNTVDPILNGDSLLLEEAEKISKTFTPIER